jgi:hypothetical protein
MLKQPISKSLFSFLTTKRGELVNIPLRNKNEMEEIERTRCIPYNPFSKNWP